MAQKEKNIYTEDNKILSVKNLQVNFKSDNGLVQAVRGVSFDLYKGETLCIVGESGSGKSVTSKSIMGILSNNAIISSGQILYEGEDLVRVSEEDFHRIRGNKIGMIFQDPLSALNPIVKVGKQIIETSLINSNILKRRYADLISSDLTALRNIEANKNYEETLAYNQVLENKKTIKQFLSLQKQLTNEKKKVEATKTLEELDIKLDSYIETILHGFENDLVAYQTELDSASEHKNQLTSLKEANIDNVPVELRLKKYDNKIKGITALVDLVNSYKNNVIFSTDDKIGKVQVINNYLQEKKKIIIANEKLERPVLKEILALRKKSAKKDVEVYEKDLVSKRDSKLAVLEKDKLALTQELAAYDASLGVEKQEEIHSIMRYNEKMKKIKQKNDTKFKENSVSKVVKDKIEFKEITDEKYSEFLKNISAIDKKIFDIKEEFINKTKVTKKEAKRKALEVMKEVGIPLPERRFKQYPFEFSGGMRQRIVIAIALTANPEILICDEPTTALDVTIQAQILELINKLKRERNLSCIFITHDLGVVANMADRVAVMYAGKIVEYGKVDEVFFEPKHPYTWALLSSIPDINSKEKLEAIPGTPPDMLYPPKGDAFALRSKYAMKIDFEYEPPFFKVSDTHFASTWLLYKEAPEVEMPKIVKTRIEVALKEAAEFEDIEKIKSEIAETVAKKGVIKNAK